jgi:hypothetical protein
MSRPSSFHGAHRDVSDDFSLPLFAPPQQQQQAYAPPPPQQHIQQQYAPPAAPPRSPLRQPPPPSSNRASTHLTPSATGYSNGSALPKLNTRQSLQSLQRQSMHFPTSYAQQGQGQGQQVAAPSAYAAEESTLGSLARSASLGTARRKDPFSYPSDDIESGMAGDWSGSSGAGAAAGASGYGGRGMPQPYVSTHRTGPERYSTHNMPPPPVPALRGPSGTSPTPAHAQPSQANNAHALPAQPSNPYLPGRDGDAWNSYRRNSHQSPQSGSVSPLGASPHSPAPPGPYDPSPHLLTPQGSTTPLPISYPSSPQQGQQHGYASTHRAHSHSFTSQPATPATHYNPQVPRPQLSRSPRQGLRAVRDWHDLKPKVSNHPQGRRADTQVPGKYMSVSELWIVDCQWTWISEPD